MPVTLVAPYNPEWPAWFERIRACLALRLGDLACGIEHLGSTSVTGMTAKPIIDLIVVIAPGTFSGVRERLIAAGYVYRGDQGIPGREVFRAIDGGHAAALPSHHLYVCEPDACELRKQRHFCDYLRAHPEWRERLSEKKWQLAESLNNDRQGYIDGKDVMVKEITALAFAEAAAQGRAPADEVTRFFDGYPAPVPELAAWLRHLLHEALPGIRETLDPADRMVAYGYGEGIRDTVCTLIPSKTGIKLGIAYGATLPDSEVLLAGRGRVHRYVTFERIEDLAPPGLEALLEAAVAAWRERSGFRGMQGLCTEQGRE